MINNDFSRRKFLGTLAGVSLLGIAGACSTSKSSNQADQKKILEDLRATKKYKEKSIEVGDNFFSPKQTTIEAGTIVIWKNEGRSLHDIIWDESEPHDNGDSHSGKTKEDGDFTSENMRANDIHVFLFEKPGKYFYHCHFHGGPKRGQWGSIKVNSTDHTP